MEYRNVATSSFKIPYINLVIREQAVRESSTETYNVVGKALQIRIQRRYVSFEVGTPVGYASVAR
jgi:hypothetical protein